MSSLGDERPCHEEHADVLNHFTIFDTRVADQSQKIVAKSDMVDSNDGPVAQWVYEHSTNQGILMF